MSIFRSGGPGPRVTPPVISNGLSWMLRPPTVFAFVIPALGILGDIVPVAAKVRQKLYRCYSAPSPCSDCSASAPSRRYVEIEEQFVYIAMAFALLLPVLMFLGGIADTMRRGGKNIGVPPTALLFALLGTLVVFAGVAMAAIRAIVSFELARGRRRPRRPTPPSTPRCSAGCAAGLGGVAWWSSKITGRRVLRTGQTAGAAARPAARSPPRCPN